MTATKNARQYQDPADADPRMRRLVAWLADHGFRTLNSAPDLSDAQGRLSTAHITIAAGDKDYLIYTTDNLHAALAIGGVTVEQIPGASIQANYDPADDGRCWILLRGVSDEHLPEPSPESTPAT